MTLALFHCCNACDDAKLLYRVSLIIIADNKKCSCGVQSVTNLVMSPTFNNTVESTVQNSNKLIHTIHNK